ncbi:MAG: septation protein SepH, partial [Acidimicrobiia bacterium]
MKKLHLVGVTPDNDGLVLSTRKGSKSGGYVVALDDELVASLERARRQWQGDEGIDEPPGPPRASPSGRPRSSLSPREIQARLRAGSTIGEVAASAGVGEEWVQRFAAPILAEQAQVVERAQQMVFAKSRLGPSIEPLAASVQWNLSDRGVRFSDDVFGDCWSAYNLHGTRWAVRFSYVSRKRHQVAEWEVDLRDQRLSARNRLAAELAHVEAGRRPPEPDLAEPNAMAAPLPVAPEMVSGTSRAPGRAKAGSGRKAVPRRPAGGKKAARKAAVGKKAAASAKVPPAAAAAAGVGAKVPGQAAEGKAAPTEKAPGTGPGAGTAAAAGTAAGTAAPRQAAAGKKAPRKAAARPAGPAKVAAAKKAARPAAARRAAAASELTAASGAREAASGARPGRGAPTPSASGEPDRVGAAGAGKRRPPAGTPGPAPGARRGAKAGAGAPGPSSAKAAGGRAPAGAPAARRGAKAAGSREPAAAPAAGGREPSSRKARPSKKAPADAPGSVPGADAA